MTTRRDFVKLAAAGGALVSFPGLLFSKDEDLPKFDYHVHLEEGLTVEQAQELSKKLQVQFGIVPHPGTRYGTIDNDEKLLAYIKATKDAGFFAGVQPVDPGWYNMFSEDARAKLDYVLMDALEIPNKDGGYHLLWLDDFKLFADVDSFMETYLNFYEQVIANEKIDILASPTFLPAEIRNDYSTIWTEKRMLRIIDVAIEHRVAIEINSLYRIPDERFVKLAKSKGAKFSFGTNGRTPDVAGNIAYSLKIAKTCGLTKKDIFLLPRNE